MRYLLHQPFASGSTPSQKLWLALHGAYGTADQGPALFGPAAQAHSALLLSPQATRPLNQGFAWSFARDHSAMLPIIETVMGENPGVENRLGLCGFSMGCTMGLWLLSKQPDRFRFFAAVGMGSAFEPWEYDDGGFDQAGLRQAAKTTPVFLAVDRHDTAGCAPYAEANLATFRELGFQVHMLRPDEHKHWVTDLITQELVAWIRRVDHSDPLHAQRPGELG